MGSAVLRVIEGGKCLCFGVADDGVDTLDTAIRLRQYLDNSEAAGFAAQFTQQMTITEQEYIDHVMNCLCDFENPANVLHVDLDGGTFSSLDAKSGWWTYPLNDAADSVRGVLPDKDASREQRTAWLRHKLDGKRIDTDERCLLLRGDRELRPSDVDILDYVGTEDGVTTFTLELRTDLETVFGTRVAKDDDTYVEVYASFDVEKGEIRESLDIGLLREYDSAYFLYQMNAETVDAIRQKMDDYCMEEDGLHLADWAAREQKASPQFLQYTI